jgi:glycosyltransferase involved in cell wall biosynthesis
MKRNSARVLVVSHDATRTGAPRVAVEIQRSLQQAGVEVISVLRAGGGMEGDFAATSNRLVREPFPRVRAVLRRRRQLHGLINRWDELVARFMLVRYRPAAVFLNTVRAANYLKPALARQVGAVLYVHETGSWAWQVLDRHPVDRWDEVRLVACSTACRDELAGVLGVPAGSVQVVHAPVDVDAVEARARAAAPDEPDEAASERGVLTVGACGTVEERKGTDLWLEAAHLVKTRRPDLDVRFRWIGRQKGTWSQQLVDELDVADVVEFTGEIAEPAPLLAGLDVFTLPSRRDPFPLVVLEAMSLARPVVAFDVGGVAEQLGDAGVIVPTESADLLAKAIIELLDDRAARDDMGRRANERVRAHWDVNVLFRPAIRRLFADLTQPSGAP